MRLDIRRKICSQLFPPIYINEDHKPEHMTAISALTCQTGHDGECIAERLYTLNFSLPFADRSTLDLVGIKFGCNKK